MHKKYEEEMNRKAHRYALLKAAQEKPVIDWDFTKNDWNVLKAADTGDALYVSVRLEVTRDAYLKYKNQYEKAQKMREAKRYCNRLIMGEKK
jgi:hypothetical protein